jgi:hypothetical protein
LPDIPRDAAPDWKVAARRLCLALAAVALGSMAWGAVHDIVRGERDLTAEWTFLVFAGLLGVCSAMTWLMRATSARR